MNTWPIQGRRHETGKALRNRGGGGVDYKMLDKVDGRISCVWLRCRVRGGNIGASCDELARRDQAFFFRGDSWSICCCGCCLAAHLGVTIVNISLDTWQYTINKDRNCCWTVVIGRAIGRPQISPTINWKSTTKQTEQSYIQAFTRPE